MKLSTTLLMSSTAMVMALSASASERQNAAGEQRAERRQEGQQADDATKPAATVTEAKASDSWLGNLGIRIIYENAVGMGTFTTTGDSAQPSWNMSYSILPSYVVDKKLKMKVGARFDFDHNVVENYASGNTVPNELQFYDIRLFFQQGSIVSLKTDAFGPLNKETGERSAVFDLGYTLQMFLPTSKASQISNKVMGLGLSVAGTFIPTDFMTLSYGFGVTKNFNQYTQQALDTSNFSAPLPSRAGGVEQLADGLVALGGSNLEWSVSHDLSLGFAWPVGLGDMGLTIGWTYFQSFTYANNTKDEFASVNAQAGRGYTDLMRGVFELSWDPIPQFGVALGWLVDQTPKTADNEDFRFPWWDTTNGADNRQTFYLDLVANF